eukprot:Gb_24555 [translate_table: standard]
MVSPSLGTKVQESLNGLFKSFVQVKEAKSKGQETHHRIQSLLDQISEWKAKLATLGNVARRNILPNMPLLSLDEVVTCENVLAKMRHVLEDEAKFDATLSEFEGQLLRQLASVGEQGNQALHEFVVGVARKAKRDQYVKEFLNLILTEHTKIVSKIGGRNGCKSGWYNYYIYAHKVPKITRGWEHSTDVAMRETWGD